ncbi:uncharacterized [Tachysurus ichikawai]
MSNLRKRYRGNAGGTINLATYLQRAHGQTHKLREHKHRGKTGGTKTKKLNVMTWEQRKNGSFGNFLLLWVQAARIEDTALTASLAVTKMRMKSQSRQSRDPSPQEATH